MQFLRTGVIVQPGGAGLVSRHLAHMMLPAAGGAAYSPHTLGHSTAATARQCTRKQLHGCAQVRGLRLRARHSPTPMCQRSHARYHSGRAGEGSEAQGPPLAHAHVPAFTCKISLWLVIHCSLQHFGVATHCSPMSAASDAYALVPFSYASPFHDGLSPDAARCLPVRLIWVLGLQR
jgi:hypothetical protein